MTRQADIDYLRETVLISRDSRAQGNHPFGALLADPDGKIVVTAGNTYATDFGIGHAELNVARKAALQFTSEILERCTLYTSVEPCCMCAGGAYWAGIGAVVFGLTEKRLAELTGNNPENLTMDMPCFSVFEAGQRKTDVRGPFPELEDEIVAVHKGFW